MFTAAVASLTAHWVDAAPPTHDQHRYSYRNSSLPGAGHCKKLDCYWAEDATAKLGPCLQEQKCFAPEERKGEHSPGQNESERTT